MNSNRIGAVIVAGHYLNECGVVVAETAKTVDVLIASPKHEGERVTVRRTSVELYEG